MTPSTTVKALAVRSNLARQDIAVEAQKIFDLYNDPTISAVRKAEVKAQLDELIKKLEDRADTARHIRNEQ